MGRWRKGGVVEVYLDGQLIEAITLPAAEWSLAALLIDAGIRSAGASWGRAFMTASDLARGLHQRSRRGNSDPANVPRFVWRLRKSIANRMSGRLENPKDWSKRLIEHHRSFGYRVSLPPENLHLETLCDRNLSGQDVIQN
jgi:hypothetical protein